MPDPTDGCLHCGAPVDTAQRKFHLSVYGLVLIHTVNGPSAVSPRSGSWCNPDCLLAWIRTKLEHAEFKKGGNSK